MDEGIEEARLVIQMTETATRLAQHWTFEPTEELPGGWCSHVYADQTRVLKCPWRGEEQTSGYRAALALAGWGGPEIFEADEATGTILMARILPGTTLDQSGLSERECREVAAGLILNQQGRIDPSGYADLRAYFTLQHPLLDQLLEFTPETVFVHGDLHHFNILWSEEHGQWIPIDPKGLCGDPAYEPIAFMRNLLEQATNQADLERLIEDRLAFFARRLNLDPWRIAAWGFIDQIDSGEDCNEALAEAYRALADLEVWG